MTVEAILQLISAAETIIGLVQNEQQLLNADDAATVAEALKTIRAKSDAIHQAAQTL